MPLTATHSNYRTRLFPITTISENIRSKDQVTRYGNIQESCLTFHNSKRTTRSIVESKPSRRSSTRRQSHSSYKGVKKMM